MQDPALLDNNLKQKTQPLDYQMIAFVFGGLERIRTAVGAFAELYLATRTFDPELLCKFNIIFLTITIFLQLFFPKCNNGFSTTYCIAYFYLHFGI